MRLKTRNSKPEARNRVTHYASRITLLALALFSGCSKQSAPTPGLLAKVGSTEIRVDDLKREAQWRLEHRRPATDKQTLLDEMILQEALLQRAKNAHLDADPQLQREIRNLIIGKLLDHEVAARQNSVTISADEVKAEYDQNLLKQTHPAKVRFALLFQEANPKMSDAKRGEQKARLQEARRMAAASPQPVGRGPAAQGFGALAINYSDDQSSRYRGGDIGWLDVGAASSRCPREVLEVGAALKKGEMSEVIEAKGGFYVIIKTDSREASITPFAQAEATIRQSLLLKKRQQIETEFRQEALRHASATVDQKALAAVDLPAVTPTRASEPPSIMGLQTASRGN